MNEQQQLTFNLGITNVPSDIVCDDNALEESLGMMYENGEHKPIQKPVQFATISASDIYSGTSQGNLLYVHRFNNQERYIVELDGHIAYGEKNAQTNVIQLVGWLWNVLDVDMRDDSVSHNLVYDTNTMVTSVGKTLIITNNDGINFYLWRNEYSVTYENPDTHVTTTWLHRCFYYMGNKIPAPKVEFALVTDVSASLDYYNSSNYGQVELAKTSGLYHDGDKWTINLVDKELWNNCAIGLYNKVRKELWKKKLFYGSFCVRCALKLADGTYYMPSDPIFMLNTFKEEAIAHIDSDEVRLGLFGSELKYKFSQDYAPWSDIVKDVTLFVTKEADLFDTQKDAICDWLPSTNPDASYRRTRFFVNDSKLYSRTSGFSHGDNSIFSILPTNPISDLQKQIKEGVYYRLCDIGAVGTGEWVSTKEKIDSHVLENITTQEQLGADDFYSHCQLFPNNIFVYNSRLTMTNVERGFFDGFEVFMPYTRAANESTPISKNYEAYVTIRTDTDDIVVKKEFTTTNKIGIYFYYPDSRAKHVVIKNVTDDAIVLDADLKEHPTLNGAYYWYGIAPVSTYHIPDDMYLEMPTVSGSATIPSVTNSPKEILPNTVITSEVNNPFEFLASGYKNVGQGKILGLTSNTQALSQGQHGQFPLLVFTTEGIWALEINKDGTMGVPDPISRDVALESNPCFTQTDNAVFYASAKGLMCIGGSQSECVSEQLRGMDAFLKDAVIAYDYAHSLLWIIQKTTTQAGQPCYVYNLKTGTFSRYMFQSPAIRNICNFYPDTLLCAQNTLFSLLNIPQEASDNASYSGQILSRPIKFGDGMALKSLRDLKIIRDMASTTGVELLLYASNTLSNWRTLKSFRGEPYKYFKIGLNFTNMKATDRFAGVIAITQARRTNKLR